MAHCNQPVGNSCGWAIFGAAMIVLALWSGPRSALAEPRAPIPDKLVVLTFDDGVKSQATFVAPLLKQHRFGATFYLSEPFGFQPDWKREHYMTWDDARKLAEDGFEIGNHTRRHRKAFDLSRDEFRADVEFIERRFAEHGIPRPKTFCYPAYYFTRDAVEVLQERGYLFARRGTVPELPYQEGGLGFAYDPSEDHPLLVPIVGASGPKWRFEDFVAAVEKAQSGKIAVLAFHGVPDLDHPWVSTDPGRFAAYMKYLGERGYTAIAMRDLAKYVDPRGGPRDPLEPIQQRLKQKGATPPRAR